MKRVLLFGGTFDPPHNGHVNNLKAAVAAVKPDHIIVMPAGVPPHKAASATPVEQRLELCRLCFADTVPGAEVEISDWEAEQAENGGRSYTVNTLTMLHERFPDAHLYLSMGSDMLVTFRQWREWEHILRLATLVVQSREEGDSAELQAAAVPLRQAGGHVVFAKAKVLPGASSDIRSGTLCEEQLRVLLPQAVLEQCRKYKLYNL